MTFFDRARAWLAGKIAPHTAPTPILDGEVVGFDLPLRRADADAARAESRTSESFMTAAGAMLDSDDDQYRRLSSGARFRTRDLSPIQQDRMLEIAWWLIESNPFAKRLIELMRDLIVGEGVTVRGKDERINEVVQRTWKHPVNKLDQRLDEFYFAFSLNGELILPVARNPFTGIPHIGYIDPMQVERVLFRPDNVLVPGWIVIKKQVGELDGARMKVINENPLTGKLEGDCFYWRTNSLPNASRGRSDLLTLADWLDIYDQLMFAEVERVKMLSAFVYDLTMEGVQDKQKIRERLEELGNFTSGTIYGHNEKEKLDAVSPDLKAQDRSEIGKTLAIHIAGSHGFPLSWMGFTDSNRATIEGQADVATKTPAARQKQFAGCVGEILRYAVEGATGLNPALFRDVEDDSFVMTFPEIQAKDIARVGGVIGNIVAAMDTAQANATMSRRAAVVVQLAVLKHLGVELEVEEVLAEADKDRADRQDAEDERMALLAKATAAQQSTAGPGGPGGQPPAPGIPPKTPKQDREPVAA